MEQIKATTILCVKKDNEVSISGDGQVSFGNSILKSSAKKVRKVYNNQILAGFAGATADAITLFDKFEAKLEESISKHLSEDFKKFADFKPVS